jgi:3-hydroxy-9,10-secoandrosta-1,3,5(10)-triene-9,17-dione monooxygenase reductase component
MEAFDASEFRKVLGTFTTGVTIVTTRGIDGQPVGITVNSFNSVSLQPPLVLWSISKAAHSLTAFAECAYWAVHILSANQEGLSNRFAKAGGQKFQSLDLNIGREGIPLLRGCAATLQCRNSLRYDGGDHVIFVGEVVELEHEPITPLVYQSGKYAVAARKLNDITISKTDSHRLDLGFDEDFLGYLLARAHFQFFGRMRELMLRAGLEDVHLFILSGLSAKETRSIAELNDIMRPARQEITPAALEVLQRRGLVNVEGEGVDGVFRLTEVGHRFAIDIIAKSKNIESEVLDRIGYWNASALKNLLKQFIVETDIGVLHPWESTDIRNVRST